MTMSFFPKIIVITGIDGSGKTTVSSLLKNELQKRNKNVKIVQQFAPIFIPKKILNRFGSTLISLERKVSDNTNFAEVKENKKNPILRNVAILRIISFGFFHTLINIAFNVHADIIISDRYFFDTILKVNWIYNKIYDNMFYPLIPKPDLVVFLDVPPEVGWRREVDGNTTLSQHISKKCVYDEFYNVYKKNNWPILKIDALQSKEEILTKILNRIDGKLSDQ